MWKDKSHKEFSRTELNTLLTLHFFLVEKDEEKGIKKRQYFSR